MLSGVSAPQKKKSQGGKTSQSDLEAPLSDSSSDLSQEALQLTQEIIQKVILTEHEDPTDDLFGEQNAILDNSAQKKIMAEL
jgi:hypothetical protein